MADLRGGQVCDELTATSSRSICADCHRSGQQLVDEPVALLVEAAGQQQLDQLGPIDLKHAIRQLREQLQGHAHQRSKIRASTRCGRLPGTGTFLADRQLLDADIRMGQPAWHGAERPFASKERPHGRSLCCAPKHIPGTSGHAPCSTISRQESIGPGAIKEAIA